MIESNEFNVPSADDFAQGGIRQNANFALTLERQPVGAREAIFQKARVTPHFIGTGRHVLKRSLPRNVKHVKLAVVFWMQAHAGIRQSDIIEDGKLQKLKIEFYGDSPVQRACIRRSQTCVCRPVALPGGTRANNAFFPDSAMKRSDSRRIGVHPVVRIRVRGIDAVRLHPLNLSSKLCFYLSA
ncbi:MAG TPA: hypothetical protein VMU43_10315 [Candidatus Acidoferrum sp.]|nr:hypothetical protein [Candidatus Acidoferrum sp.]